MSELVDEGHVYYPHEERKEKASVLLEVDKAVLDTALVTLAEQGRVLIDEWPEARAVYLTPLL